MSDISLKATVNNRQRRRWRVRSTVVGTADRPRLSVKISNRHVSAQIIDDSKHTTLVSTSTVGKKSVKGNLSAKAEWVGKEIAKKAAAKSISKVVLDRGSKLYHGRVKSLAEAARVGGLEF